MMTEIINDAICSRPSILIDGLGLEGKLYGDRYEGPASCHGGDNYHGMVIYFNEYYGVRGRWKCLTRGCSDCFPKSLIGLCRAILSYRHCGWESKGDGIYPWDKTLEYLKGLYNIDGCASIDPAAAEKNQFIRSCHSMDEKEKKYMCSLDKYLKCYSSPSKYFRERGFSDSVLEKFYVRHCDRPDSEFYTRSIVPAADVKNRNVVGVSARTTCNEEPKWRFNKGFPASTNLYGYGFANEYIRRSRCCVITESPGCIWRLHEAGIYNCVAIWGASGWNDYKGYLLDKLGVMKLVLALDNDEAGRKGTEKIRSVTQRLYNTVDIQLPPGMNDVADLSVEQVKDLFKCI